MKTFKEFFHESRASKAWAHTDEFMKNTNNDIKKSFNLKVKISMDAYWDLFSNAPMRDIIKTDIQISQEKPLRSYKKDDIYIVKGKRFDYHIPKKYVDEIH